MQPNRYKNYLRLIEKSVGSEMFQSLYVTLDDGTELDVTRCGELSCAIHTSSILALAGLIDKPHATVSTTIKSMLENGWVKVDESLPGAVIHWLESHDGHEHLGFWLDERKVISNSQNDKVPIRHSEKMSDGRVPMAFFVYPDLYKNK